MIRCRWYYREVMAAPWEWHTARFGRGRQLLIEPAHHALQEAILPISEFDYPLPRRRWAPYVGGPKC